MHVRNHADKIVSIIHGYYSLSRIGFQLPSIQPCSLLVIHIKPSITHTLNIPESISIHPHLSPIIHCPPISCSPCLYPPRLTHHWLPLKQSIVQVHGAGIRPLDGKGPSYWERKRLLQEGALKRLWGEGSGHQLLHLLQAMEASYGQRPRGPVMRTMTTSWQRLLVFGDG